MRRERLTGRRRWEGRATRRRTRTFRGVDEEGSEPMRWRTPSPERERRRRRTSCQKQRSTNVFARDNCSSFSSQIFFWSLEGRCSPSSGGRTGEKQSLYTLSMRGMPRVRASASRLGARGVAVKYVCVVWSCEERKMVFETSNSAPSPASSLNVNGLFAGRPGPWRAGASVSPSARHAPTLSVFDLVFSIFSSFLFLRI